MDDSVLAAELEANFTGSRTPSAKESGTPVLDLLLILSRGKRFLVLATLTAMVLGALVAFTTKPTFTAVAVIMPPQAPQSSLSSLMGQLGSLSALGGGNLLKNPADLYVGILQSRTIAEQAIRTFRLQQTWHSTSMYQARNQLASHVQFEAAKDGLIHITAKDSDPKLASDLANFFLDALYHVNSTLAISEAAQRRLFFENQLSAEKAALTAAEETLRKTQQQTGILTMSGQTELAVRSIAQTRAAIASKEVELQSLRTYEASENPDIIRLNQEVATLRNQLTVLENNQQRLAPGDTQIAANQMPAGSLEYARALRDVKYHDTLYDLLSRQYEAARIDEAKSAPILQVIDRAEPPDHKSGPPRLLMILGSMVCGFLAACGWLFYQGALEHARRTPAIAYKLQRLRDQLRWRRTSFQAR